MAESEDVWTYGMAEFKALSFEECLHAHLESPVSVRRFLALYAMYLKAETEGELTAVIMTAEKDSIISTNAKEKLSRLSS